MKRGKQAYVGKFRGEGGRRGGRGGFEEEMRSWRATEEGAGEVSSVNFEKAWWSVKLCLDRKSVV